MPASLYKKTRNPASRNPNPTVITGKGTVQTSRQITDYVLCKECELRFSQKGEDYVMTQVATTREFPLLDTLRSVPPTKTAAGFDWYDEATVPGVDRDRLVYFSLSVFWRAAAHRWERLSVDPISIDLGLYEEELRKYLHDETSLPTNVVSQLVVCTDKLSQDLFYPPSRGRKKEDTTYTFQACGLNFFMTVGNRIPGTIRQMCLLTGTNKWIVSRSCEEKVKQAADRLGKSRR
ncbi:MAG TPA: hypothetical protein VNZ03_05680 [Terriglobales bacterium]|nr:hypothetical protein [Terriglobales bacterium]